MYHIFHAINVLDECLLLNPMITVPWLVKINVTPFIEPIKYPVRKTIASFTKKRGEIL